MLPGPRRRPGPNRSIDASPTRLRPCEQRLALSASLAAELLLSPQHAWFDGTLEGTLNALRPADEPPAPAPDLLTQAARLRQDAGIDGSGQTVVVIDSGIAWDHHVFGGGANQHHSGGGLGPGYRVVAGWDFAEQDANPYDDGPAGFHGTHVAGLLAGQSETFVGVAPGADLVALRVFDNQGIGELAWIESALQWVHEHRDAFDSPITTVNLSVGTMLGADRLADAQAMLEDELQQLREANILVFAAAGNAFDVGQAGEIMYPASSPWVQAVTSHNGGGQLSDFAMRGPDILAARGEAVTSSVPDHVFGWDGVVDDMASLTGSSMATPQVAAASMLVRQMMIQEGLDPTADEVMQRLHETSIQRVDPLTGETFRLVDLEAAWQQTRETMHSAASTGAEVLITRYDGDNDSQHVILDLRDGIRLTVNGDSFLLDPNSGQPLVIDVGGGADSLQIIGSDQAERLILDPRRPEFNRLTTNAYEIELRGFVDVIFDGGGGRDRATLYDAEGNQTLRAQPGQATLSGVGFRYEINQVPRIFAHATGGGSDTAFLHDSPGNDVLNVRPQFTSLRSDVDGESSFLLAYGFEQVYAYATNGGVDTAELYDSAGNDIINISPSRAIMTGPDYRVSARGFDLVNAYATAGGDDVVRIFAAAGANQWQLSGDMIRWVHTPEEDSSHGAPVASQVHVVRGFSRREVFEDFQPVPLTPLSLPASLTHRWQDDDPADQIDREADAVRRVFDSLGRTV